MGCSDSKAQPSDQQKQPTAKAPTKTEETPAKQPETSAPAEETKPQDPQKEPQQESQEEDSGEPWKSKEDAVNYLVKELGVTQENAEKIVDSVNEDGDNEFSEKEANQMKALVVMAKRDLEPLFKEADKDGSGKVTLSEAVKALSPRFPGMDDKQMKRMLKKYTDADGNVEYGKFILFYTFILGARTELRPVFEAADANGTGVVTLTEGAQKLCEKYPNMEERTVKKMLYNCGDKNGHVSYEEFIVVFAGLKASRKNVIKKFHALEKDGDGMVQESVVIQLLVTETDMDEEQCNAIVQKSDDSNDARVSTEEFINAFSRITGF